jgi:hypothetical protein
MAEMDDDATVTQLATAWVGVQLGGSKVKEAAYIYQELGDKFNWTVRGGSGVRQVGAAAWARVWKDPKGGSGRLRASAAGTNSSQPTATPLSCGVRCGSQAPLHNGLAVCNMKMGEWEDAERELQVRAAAARMLPCAVPAQAWVPAPMTRVAS